MTFAWRRCKLFFFFFKVHLIFMRKEYLFCLFCFTIFSASHKQCPYRFFLSSSSDSLKCPFINSWNLLLLCGSLSFSLVGSPFTPQFPQASHFLLEILVFIPEKPHVSESLGHRVVNLVWRIPVIHFFSLGQWGLFK